MSPEAYSKRLVICSMFSEDYSRESGKGTYNLVNQGLERLRGRCAKGSRLERFSSSGAKRLKIIATDV